MLQNCTSSTILTLSSYVLHITWNACVITTSYLLIVHPSAWDEQSACIRCMEGHKVYDQIDNNVIVSAGISFHCTWRSSRSPQFQVHCLKLSSSSTTKCYKVFILQINTNLLYRYWYRYIQTNPGGGVGFSVQRPIRERTAEMGLKSASQYTDDPSINLFSKFSKICLTLK